MRSRIIGGIALALGITIIGAMLLSKKPIEFKALLGGLVFIGLGGYYFITGKTATTLKEFISEGKLSHEKPGTKNS